MSAADLSLVGAAAYTARTKRARLRVHGGEEEEERTGRFIGRTQLARETIRWTDDAPRVFTSFTREDLGRRGRAAAWLPRHTPLEKCPISSRSVIYIGVAMLKWRRRVMMVVVVRFESWLGLSLLPSFENVYIYFFTCCGSSRDLYGDTKEETERVESGNRFVACRYRFERPSNRIKSTWEF